MNRIPIPECVKGRVYRVHCRNLTLAVYDGNEGFIGIRIRIKFGNRYLFTEYHWDQGPPYGTVSAMEDTGVDLPKEIVCAESLGIFDEAGREVAWDPDLPNPKLDGYKGWKRYVETGEPVAPGTVTVVRDNRALFEYLDAFDE